MSNPIQPRPRRSGLRHGLVAPALAALAAGVVAVPDDATAECVRQYVLNVEVSDLDSDDRFGTSVAVDGDLALVSAVRDDDLGLNSGAVYLYRWNETEWLLQQKLTAPDGQTGDEFGGSVAIRGAFLMIGARGDDDRGSQAGAVYVFGQSPDGAWEFEQKLYAPDAAAADEFGAALSFDGVSLVVGARLDDDLGGQSGSAHVFAYDGSGWAHRQKLLDDNGQAQDNFGVAVSVSGSRIAIGADRSDMLAVDAGIAALFEWDGSAWIQTETLTAWDGLSGDRFGSALALSGTSLVVGAHRNDEQALDAGAAYSFGLSDRNAVPQQKLLADPAAQGDLFGVTIAMGEGLLLVGAGNDDSAGLNAGAAHLFVRDGLAWSPRTRFLAPDAASFDGLGNAVALGRDFAIVGAAMHDGSSSDTGSAYVFDVICWTACPEDLDGDGRVGVGDLSTLLTNFGRNHGATPKQGDVNQDGVIDLADLADLLVRYGLPCSS